jgi:hypothetical protein
MQKGIDKLYSVICFFNGGTYIKQIEASSESEVLSEWIDYIGNNNDIGISQEEMNVLRQYHQESNFIEPVLILGLKNVWCSDTQPIDNYLSITIVKTLRK